MIAVFAKSDEEAQAWFRCSGTDPASCVVVRHGDQFTDAGVFGPAQGTDSAEWYPADEITEVIAVGGPKCWWLSTLECRNNFHALCRAVSQKANA